MRNHSMRFFKYIAVGGSAAVINWLVFYMCFMYLEWQYLLAGCASFILATAWNFILARKFIFTPTRHGVIMESSLVYGASLAGLLVDIGVLYICVEWLGMQEMLSKIIATGAAFVLNFALRNFLIYKE